MKTKKTEPWLTWEEYKEKDLWVAEDELPTVYRLNRMVALGYEIDHQHGQTDPTSIYLSHPNEKLPHRDFYLGAKGDLVEAYSGRDREQIRIDAQDGEAFEHFCRSVPATAKPKYLNPPLPLGVKVTKVVLYGVFILIGLGISSLVGAIFN